MRSSRQAHQRLEQLYEVNKLFATFENVEQIFEPTLGIVTRTLPLRSAILIKVDDDRSKMIVWPSEGQNSGHMRTVKQHLQAAYAYLVGAASTVSRAGTEANLAKKFIVIPLVVAHHPPFGALQLEGVQPFDKADLIFVNAIANQLAIALDRDRRRRRDITRREIAERSREKYQALADENARLYEQARQAVREREQILAIVSHDLKNPLGTILMTTATLAKRGISKERRRELPQAVGRIQRSAERMQRLIEDLLDFASIEAGRVAIKPQPHDPVSMIHETLACFESVSQETQLRLTADVEPDLPAISCDRDRILQVLSNLVDNAIKATAEGGQIVVRAEARGHELLFAVSDDGPGISEEDAKHLFERYWRSDEANYQGTGLGLAIAGGIVSAHGGRIWAESELGRGATFLFTVPAADLAPGEGANHSHPQPNAAQLYVV